MATKKLAKKMEKELKDVLRVVQAGGGYSKAEIAAFNEEYSQRCDYCRCEVCDLEHIIWHCTFFSQVRRQHNSVLASINPRDLNAAVLRGIAPAMRCRPGATFWGQAVAADATEEQVKLLGGGINDIPELILQEVELAWRSNLNCRQYVACKRGQFGGGVDLQFPKNISNEAPAEINVYGDGSMKNPADQAWSLSGFGVWWPEAVDDAQFRESLPSQNYVFEEVNQEGIG